jgi:hypothetical protein
MPSICTIKIRTMPSRIIYETAKFREPISRKKMNDFLDDIFYVSFVCTTFFKNSVLVVIGKSASNYRKILLKQMG